MEGCTFTPITTVFASLLFLVFSCGKKNQDCPNEPQKPVVVEPVKDPPCDDVYGVCIARDDSFRTENGKIFHDGKPLHVKGINWFGMETSTSSFHGVWTGRKLEEFVDQMKGLGFNAFRIPVSPESLLTSNPGRDGFNSSRENIEALLEYTESVGMYVLLDMHMCTKNGNHLQKPGPGIGACSFYTQDKFIGDMRELAELSNQYKNVIGIDLFNEPFGFTWTQWKKLSERAGEAILRINPRTLVFVEGIAGASKYGSDYPFWGENLYEAASDPVNVPKSRLVYSPHVYGPSVSGQPYFNQPSFPSNMPKIWNEHYGKHAGKLPLVIGEFGGRYVGQDQVWADAFVDYLIANNITDFFYWSMNPNSGDTGGLLLDDWRTVDQRKLKLIKRLMRD